MRSATGLSDGAVVPVQSDLLDLRRPHMQLYCRFRQQDSVLEGNCDCWSGQQYRSGSCPSDCLCGLTQNMLSDRVYPTPLRFSPSLEPRLPGNVDPAGDLMELRKAFEGQLRPWGCDDAIDIAHVDLVIHPALRNKILAEATVRQWSGCERQLPEFRAMFEGVSEQRTSARRRGWSHWPVDPGPVASRIRPRLTEIHVYPGRSREA